MSEPLMQKIAVAVPDLSGNEEKYAVEAIRSSWISSTGAFLNRFEAEFAELTAGKQALAVANGTVALHLALLGLGVGAGDEVIIPSLTYIATANAVRYVGAEPVFVDVDPATWCIDPAAIETAITPRTKAIIPVHLYGHPADMDAINAIAKAHGLWVVEDAAEACGALYKGRPAGALGDVGTFSFYGNKILTSGEGGAVVVNDLALGARLKLLRGQGMDPERRYFFPVVGHNFRLTNVAAAILCAQLEREAEILAARRQVFSWYVQHLQGVAGVHLQPVSPDVVVAPWLYCITLDETFGLSRDALMAELDKAGIETRPFFIPIHRLPPYSQHASQSLPHTERLAATGLNLPTYNALSEDQVRYICDTIRKLGR